MRISTHVDVYQPSEYHYGLFVAKLDDMFLLAFLAIFVSLRGTQTWRLHTKPYIFEKNISSNISHKKHRTDLSLYQTV